MAYDLDSGKIAANRQAYRHLSPSALTELDENRHQLSGEEAAALDEIMAELDRAPRIAGAIAHLDAVKRRSFRLGLLGCLLAVAAIGCSAWLPSPWNTVVYIVAPAGAACYAHFIRSRLL